MARGPIPPLQEAAKAARTREAGQGAARPEVEEALMPRRGPTLPLEEGARAREAGRETARPEVEEAP